MSKFSRRIFGLNKKFLTLSITVSGLIFLGSIKNTLTRNTFFEVYDSVCAMDEQDKFTETSYESDDNEAINVINNLIEDKNFTFDFNGLNYTDIITIFRNSLFGENENNEFLQSIVQNKLNYINSYYNKKNDKTIEQNINKLNESWQYCGYYALLEVLQKAIKSEDFSVDVQTLAWEIARLTLIGDVNRSVEGLKQFEKELYVLLLKYNNAQIFDDLVKNFYNKAIEISNNTFGNTFALGRLESGLSNLVYNKNLSLNSANFLKTRFAKYLLLSAIYNLYYKCLCQEANAQESNYSQTGQEILNIMVKNMFEGYNGSSEINDMIDVLIDKRKNDNSNDKKGEGRTNGSLAKILSNLYIYIFEICDYQNLVLQQRPPMTFVNNDFTFDKNKWNEGEVKNLKKNLSGNDKILEDNLLSSHVNNDDGDSSKNSDDIYSDIFKFKNNSLFGDYDISLSNYSTSNSSTLDFPRVSRRWFRNNDYDMFDPDDDNDEFWGDEFWDDEFWDDEFWDEDMFLDDEFMDDEFFYIGFWDDEDLDDEFLFLEDFEDFEDFEEMEDFEDMTPINGDLNDAFIFYGDGDEEDGNSNVLDINLSNFLSMNTSPGDVKNDDVLYSEINQNNLFSGMEQEPVTSEIKEQYNRVNVPVTSEIKEQYNQKPPFDSIRDMNVESFQLASQKQPLDSIRDMNVESFQLASQKPPETADREQQTNFENNAMEKKNYNLVHQQLENPFFILGSRPENKTNFSIGKNPPLQIITQTHHPGRSEPMQELLMGERYDWNENLQTVNYYKNLENSSKRTPYDYQGNKMTYDEFHVNKYIKDIRQIAQKIEDARSLVSQLQDLYVKGKIQDLDSLVAFLKLLEFDLNENIQQMKLLETIPNGIDEYLESDKNPPKTDENGEEYDIENYPSKLKPGKFKLVGEKTLQKTRTLLSKVRILLNKIEQSDKSKQSDNSNLQQYQTEFEQIFDEMCSWLRETEHDECARNAFIGAFSKQILGLIVKKERISFNEIIEALIKEKQIINYFIDKNENANKEIQDEEEDEKEVKEEKEEKEKSIKSSRRRITPSIRSYVPEKKKMSSETPSSSMRSSMNTPIIKKQKNIEENIQSSSNIINIENDEENLKDATELIAKAKEYIVEPKNQKQIGEIENQGELIQNLQTDDNLTSRQKKIIYSLISNMTLENYVILKDNYLNYYNTLKNKKQNYNPDTITDKPIKKLYIYRFATYKEMLEKIQNDFMERLQANGVNRFLTNFNSEDKTTLLLLLGYIQYLIKNGNNLDLIPLMNNVIVAAFDKEDKFEEDEGYLKQKTKPNKTLGIENQLTKDIINASFEILGTNNENNFQIYLNDDLKNRINQERDIPRELTRLPQNQNHLVRVNTIFTNFNNQIDSVVERMQGLSSQYEKEIKQSLNKRLNINTLTPPIMFNLNYINPTRRLSEIERIYLAYNMTRDMVDAVNTSLVNVVNRGVLRMDNDMNNKANTEDMTYLTYELGNNKTKINRNLQKISLDDYLVDLIINPVTTTNYTTNSVFDNIMQIVTNDINNRTINETAFNVQNKVQRILNLFSGNQNDGDLQRDKEQILRILANVGDNDQAIETIMNMFESFSPLRQLEIILSLNDSVDVQRSIKYSLLGRHLVNLFSSFGYENMQFLMKKLKNKTEILKNEENQQRLLYKKGFSHVQRYFEIFKRILEYETKKDNNSNKVLDLKDENSGTDKNLLIISIFKAFNYYKRMINNDSIFKVFCKELEDYFAMKIGNMRVAKKFIKALIEDNFIVVYKAFNEELTETLKNTEDEIEEEEGEEQNPESVINNGLMARLFKLFAEVNNSKGEGEEHILSINDIDDIENEFNDFSYQKYLEMDLKNERNDLDKQTEDLQKRQKRLKDNNKELRTEIANLKQQSKEINDEQLNLKQNSNLEKTIASTNYNRYSKTKEYIQRDELQPYLDYSDKKLRIKREELKKTKKTLENFHEKYKKTSARILKFDQDYNNKKQQLKKLDEENAEKRNKMVNIIANEFNNNDTMQLKDLLNIDDDENENENNSIIEIDEQINGFDEGIKELELKIKDLNNEENEITLRINDDNSKNEKLLSDLNRLSKELDEVSKIKPIKDNDEENKRRETQVNELQAQVNEIVKNMNELENNKKEFEKQLTKIKDSKEEINGKIEEMNLLKTNLLNTKGKQKLSDILKQTYEEIANEYENYNKKMLEDYNTEEIKRQFTKPKQEDQELLRKRFQLGKTVSDTLHSYSKYKLDERRAKKYRINNDAVTRLEKPQDLYNKNKLSEDIYTQFEKVDRSIKEADKYDNNSTNDTTSISQNMNSSNILSNSLNNLGAGKKYFPNQQPFSNPIKQDKNPHFSSTFQNLSQNQLMMNPNDFTQGRKIRGFDNLSIYNFNYNLNESDISLRGASKNGDKNNPNS